MTDPFANRMRTPSDPAATIFDISPSDTADLDHPTTALNVITPGRVRVTTVDGSTGTISLHPGHTLPIRVQRVWQTGTTATGITGLT